MTARAHNPPMLTESETRALLTSALLVALAAVGRVVLQPPPAEVRGAGLREVARVDSALAVAESALAESELRSQPLGRDERVDPNVASEAELDRLPGVGPSLARAIVTVRDDGGPFRSVRDLERVPGLGRKKIERIAPYVSLPEDHGRPEGSTGWAVSGADGPRGGTAGARVDINQATAAELEGLPGIGPSRARAIVRWREERGRFDRLEDLLGVPGIGPATLERLRGRARVGP